MKKKVIMAVFLVGILTLVGLSVYYLNSFFNSPEMLTKKYSEELGDVIHLDEKQRVIRVIKEDLNNNDILDYVVLYGTEKYSDVSSVEGAAPNLEMYSDVGIQYINGENSEIIKYCTGKTFDVNVDVSVVADDENKYIFIADANSGTSSLLKLNQDNTFTDILKESLGDNPKGYMISSSWDTAMPSKFKIKLDKEDIGYLPEQTKEYVLDYTNTKVNSTSYRQKYVMNKFNCFITKNDKVDGTLNLEIIGVQNILYLNSTSSNEKNDYKQSQGKVKTVFKIEDNKLVVKDVIVEK